MESIEATPELLDVLESRWRSCAAPIASDLRAGIDDEEMEAITLPLGLTLSREARAWWSWHDGVSLASGETAREVNNGFSFLPLAEASQAYAVERWAARGAASLEARYGSGRPVDAESYWPRAWFPMLAVKFAYIVCDVSVDPSPVFYKSREELGLPDDAAASSIGAMVQLWIESIDTGYARVRSATGRWTRARQKMPAGPRWSPVVGGPNDDLRRLS